MSTAFTAPQSSSAGAAEEVSRHGAAEAMAELAASAGLARVEIIAWRDLDHPEAGGSEVHAARIAERWTAAGIDVTLTASRARGAPRRSQRDGYTIRRPAGRYGIFPAVGAAGLSRRRARPDATVEVWNGMPFFSPVWSSGRRLVFLHHVHEGMWDLVMPGPLAAAGRFVEGRIAPPMYRRTPVVTLSSSSREAIVETLGLPPGQVHVVPPGVDETFSPGGRRSRTPLVVAVGRLVAYKRFDRLISVLCELKASHPDLQAVIAGEGTERPHLERLISSLGASNWIDLPGWVPTETLVDLYRRAWVLATTSAFEGWGLTVTDAAACGTPAVASDIPGHRDAVDEGVTGFLREPGPEMVRQLDLLLTDSVLRRRMQKAALARAGRLTWDRTALEALALLAGPPGR